MVISSTSRVQTGPNPEDNTAHRLEIVKTNLAAHPDALGVCLGNR